MRPDEQSFLEKRKKTIFDKCKCKGSNPYCSCYKQLKLELDEVVAGIPFRIIENKADVLKEYSNKINLNECYLYINGGSAGKRAQLSKNIYEKLNTSGLWMQQLLLSDYGAQYFVNESPLRQKAISAFTEGYIHVEVGNEHKTTNTATIDYLRALISHRLLNYGPFVISSDLPYHEFKTTYLKTDSIYNNITYLSLSSKLIVGKI